jgi:integrase
VKREFILAGQVPPIPSLKSRAMDTRRPHFTHGEWSRVTNYLHHHYLKEIPASVGNFHRLYEFYREQNKHLWLMLAHSMCRVGEMRQLRWGQIEFRKVRDPRRDNGHVERVILAVNGKTGRRQAICQPYAKIVIRRWQDICKQYEVTTAPGSLVFRHPHFTNKGQDYIDKPLDTTNKAFQIVLRRLGLDTDVEGRKRSVYSIRHSAITWALQGNVNAVSVAKNAGTSLEMIQKFYDHSLSTDYISELTKFDVTGADDR